MTTEAQHTRCGCRIGRMKVGVSYERTPIPIDYCPLHAHAEELLEALEELAGQVEELSQPHPDLRAWEHAIKRGATALANARALIRKVKGEA